MPTPPTDATLSDTSTPSRSPAPDTFGRIELPEGAFGATVASTTEVAGTAGRTGAGRSTILPRVEADGVNLRLIAEEKDRYEPVRKLGAGGMGEVLLVQDHDIGRPVAVKRLLPASQTPAALVRFVDEIRTIGRLEHPNIVPIHDVGRDEEQRYYFVMKHVDGETLESIIEKLAAGDPAYHRRYSFEARIELFVGVLHALQFAHSRGIVHRDIKPANVMVGKYGEVVLMDWGIAKVLDGTPERPATAEMPASGDERAPLPDATR